MSKSSQFTQASQSVLPISDRLAERGSIVLLLAIVVFVFMAASLMFAGAQLNHTKRLRAEFAKLQAVYAAEAGIYAAFDAKQSVPVSTLWTATGSILSFEAVKGADSWVSSTGSALVDKWNYQATARAYVSGNQIVMWEFK